MKASYRWTRCCLALLLMTAVVLTVLVLNNVFPDGRLETACTVSRIVCNGLFAVIGLANFGYYALVRKKLGGLTGDKIWLLLGSALILRAGIVLFSQIYFGFDSFPGKAYALIHIACLLALLLFLGTTTCIAASSFARCPDGVKYLIVHGCRVGSVMLDSRTDAARVYLAANECTLAIASGGKGSDEPQSESSYIAARLKAAGIPEERILTEDRSRDTRENLINSVRLMPEGEKSIAVVTDDYHIFRTRCLARRILGFWVEALPAHSSRISLPHYVLREYFSILYHALKGDLAL